ncbi:UDP-N-acetylmuramoyl-L-alanyl-D-glutamate--2,6-diaminopimelate ligase [Campylobacter sp. VicNov18]|uniref:UDP-N-acetylmuramoyl-L-alanyl-D-glutamate--2, 6-diaminopimelate ligase n=1 Tax=Campylobacter bilis TaxID=2691918 RepID=UPI00132A0D94|nr:UDP-N-acetylmuramoyl-L-alanyl-D-glutamate--2,6-diaminopimelate ligase [Campylobacter bilis]MPV63749.1 UDP-N-acetylmuramoyl-L-alanyl-D-glutamate--2,6-diaminopimelate ligase [Campylobacter hepaticus]MBM0637250.1 UDP-N-acetylmuramoyl-L-alanyl-D-glutamate--2,6-diaminopimelate ligase [Campylobacter bilis]MCC8277969.1 UDP-N-acetylmuramoyl-L-alanyl-D-glutamate--2,6-diaminopimelate ligase [Campylobacter bilis]MCC8299473.1 UDP-N-acetylmuramoyl-L-alanyl-D-glutamate--2,6-diaminopimelate ligase [Campylo
MKLKLENTFITDNTLECQKDCFFLHTAQNTAFKDQALKQGAKIIEIDECKKLLNLDENIKIIGITGTNGKTTTAAAIYSILLDLGYKCGLCGTRGAFINDEQIDQKSLTTSAILKTLEYLKIASEKRCDFFIMEVSSHALVQNRIEGLTFAAKIFTNITQDHLDFHATFENYKKAKELFFTDESLKFINKDALAIAFNVRNAFTYGIENPALYQIKAYTLEDGIHAIVKVKDQTFHIDSPLLGLFNLYNLLAASACVHELLKPDLKKLEKAIKGFGGVYGRVEQVAKGVIIDFAHTPDGIEKVLEALKNKKLIVVFGAGGDRDKSKRPLMGKTVEHFAKTAIITSDNPRSEDPKDIMSQILSGFKNPSKALIIEDRKKAIEKALELKEKDDLVVILGKGDENYQEIKGIKHPFNDKAVVNEILNNQG